jgi:hypothetical protein
MFPDVSGGSVRSRDIVSMTALFLLCFFFSEGIVNYFIPEGAIPRFLLRVALLIQYSIIISFLFGIDDTK